MDAIHEYLLTKGVEAASTHGGKDQEERTAAVQQFRNHEKDVLVATDVASKGLDFPGINHVINYDMPEDIENYGKIFIVFYHCRRIATMKIVDIIININFFFFYTAFIPL